MSICNAHSRIIFTLTLAQLLIVTSCRDLGVAVSHNLLSSTHIDAMLIKAHQRANLIRLSLVSRNTTLLVRAYFAYVRPLLEYNSVIWSPLLKHVTTNCATAN